MFANWPNSRILIPAKYENSHSRKLIPAKYRKIGKKGLKTKKREGDNCTPKGNFKIGKVYYRSDRVHKPETKLKTKIITKNMGWSNDPYNINYNKKIS